MVVGMHIVAVVGLVWLSFTIFRHASIGDLIARLPRFLILGFLWLVFVMFGALLLGAFAETNSEQELPVHEQLPITNTFSTASTEFE